MKLNETWDVVCMTGLRLSEEGHNARMCVWFVLSGVRGKRRVVRLKTMGKETESRGVCGNVAFHSRGVSLSKYHRCNTCVV